MDDIKLPEMSIPTFTTAVVVAFEDLGIMNMTMLYTGFRVWQQLQSCGAVP